MLEYLIAQISKIGQPAHEGILLKGQGLYATIILIGEGPAISLHLSLHILASPDHLLQPHILRL